MTKCIIYTRPDGGVSIVHPAPAFLKTFKRRQQGLNAVLARDVPAGSKQVKIVNVSALPERTFRDAWVRTRDGGVAVDLGKARAVHEEKVRSALARSHEALDLQERRGHDVAAQRQQLAGIDVAAIATDLESVKTVVALAKIWPDGLARPEDV